MKTFIFCMVVLFSTNRSFAQIIGEVNVLDRDAFYIQYSPSNTISKLMNYQRWSSKLSIPPVKINKLHLYNGVGVDIHQFKNAREDLDINFDELNRFYHVNYNVLAAYKFSDKWALNIIVSPFLRSNLSGDLSIDDFKCNGNVFIEKIVLRNNGGYYKIGLGMGYLTMNGKTQFVQIAHLKARLNKKWSFVLGIPNTYVKLDINERQMVKALVNLNDFTANTTGKVFENQNAKAFNTVFTTASIGLEYNYWLSSSFGFMIGLSQAVYSSFELRNTENELVYEFGLDKNNPIMNIGFKFNPIRNIQNKLYPDL